VANCVLSVLNKENDDDDDEICQNITDGVGRTGVLTSWKVFIHRIAAVNIQTNNVK